MLDHGTVEPADDDDDSKDQNIVEAGEEILSMSEALCCSTVWPTTLMHSTALSFNSFFVPWKLQFIAQSNQKIVMLEGE